MRAAEKTARERHLALYATALAPPPQRTASPSPALRRTSMVPSCAYGAVVRSPSLTAMVASAAYSLELSDPRQAYYAQEAREFLRKLVGKTVKVTVDFVRPREGDYEEREAATVRYGNQNANIAEQLIEKSLAGAVRRRRDNEDRSPGYDKLMAAEQA